MLTESAKACYYFDTGKGYEKEIVFGKIVTADFECPLYIQTERQERMEEMSEKTKEQAAETESEKDCCKKKHRDEKEYRDLINRLKRIEGQVRGIGKMVEEERYCVDILTQVSAIQSALNSFNKQLLSNHIKSCVVQDIQEGRVEAVDELCATIQRLMK